MKKFLIVLLFGFLGTTSLLISLSCNNSTPSSANFQSPLQTLAAINPSPTDTPTSTFTNSPTLTPTDTPTSTPTDTPTPTP